MGRILRWLIQTSVGFAYAEDNLKLEFGISRCGSQMSCLLFKEQRCLFSSGWVCTQSARRVGFVPCEVDTGSGDSRPHRGSLFPAGGRVGRIGPGS